MNTKFYDFCKKNKMTLIDDSGNLTVQGKAVMETKNCVVAAGAGSGKTTVLSYRFLRMVAQGISPERILTITFTKKATAEMKGRIYELLQKGHEEGLVSSAAMKKFSEVTIATVDSFCTEIVRKDAVHQGVPVDFRIQDDDDFQQMSNTIVDKLLERHSKDSAVRLLHTYLSVDNIEEIFRDIAYKFLNIANPFDNIQDCLDFVKHELNEAKENLEKSNLGRRENRDALELTNAALEKENLSTLDSLYKLVQEYETEIFNAKRAAGVLAFVDVMQLAIKILKENSEIRDFYKTKFDNIMIDEFQDNNDDYRKLLYLLSEKQDSHICDEEGIPVKENLCPNKIFLVGDEKQSIYKFRGADVTVFKRLCRDLCSEPIKLNRNWRSEPAIIDFCNTIFPEHIMPRSTTCCEEYEAQYEDLETRPATLGLESRIVFLHPEIPEDSNKAKVDCKTEAQVVASLIKEMCSLKSRFLVPDDSLKDEAGNPVLRAPHYNEIGLLFKVGSHQAFFEQALTEQGVPYTVTEARSLMKGNLVNDFYNVLQYCVFPYDNISFAAYLKSPFCSLKDNEIEQILKEESPKKEDNLAELKQVIATGSICQTLDFLWFNMGYRDYMISKSLNRPYMDDFDYLYSIAVKYDKKGESLVSFLDYLRPLLNSTDKIEIDSVFKEKIDGVQIMTIHKSKGLAFKVVIVADMNSGARTPGGFQPEIYADKEKHRLTVRYVSNNGQKLINPIFELHKAKETALDNAEAKRILYVAATRARYHLIFSGSDLTCTVKNNQLNSLMAYLLDAIRNTNKDLKNYEELSIKPQNDINKATQDKSKEYFKQLFDCATITKLTPSIPRLSVTHSEDAQEKQTMAQNSNNTRVFLPKLECDAIIESHNFATGFGTLTHKILEDNLKGQQELISSHIEELLANENFTGEQQKILVSCANQLASNFLKGKLYDQIKDMTLMSEKRFLLFNGINYIDGVIDLLALDKNNVYLIDFKTDASYAKEDHKYQLGQYIKAVQSIYPNKTIHSYVCYLREDDLVLEL